MVRLTLTFGWELPQRVMARGQPVSDLWRPRVTFSFAVTVTASMWVKVMLYLVALVGEAVVVTVAMGADVAVKAVIITTIIIIITTNPGEGGLVVLNKMRILQAKHQTVPTS